MAKVSACCNADSVRMIVTPELSTSKADVWMTFMQVVIIQTASRYRSMIVFASTTPPPPGAHHTEVSAPVCQEVHSLTVYELWAAK